MMSYSEMVQKFGELMALDMLMAVEKMAHVHTDEQLLTMTEDERLERARAELDRLDEERKTAWEAEQNKPHSKAKQ